MSSPRSMARIAGLAYLVTVVTGLFAELFVRGSMIVTGNAAATAHNILAAQTLYRAGFAADLVGGAAYVVVTLLLYELLRPANSTVSLMAASFSLVGIAIGGIAALGHLAPLFLLNGAPYLRAFDLSQLQAMALLSLKLHAQGYLIALVFFGFYEVLLGYLIFESQFLPRALGILVALAGVAFLVNSFTLFVSPVVGNELNAAMLVIDGIGEISLTLWLLTMGVNETNWRARAYATSAS